MSAVPNSSVSSAPSARKIAANQENAQHSTGPKSPDGKSRSSQNASSHRIFAPHLLQPGESPSAYHAFREPLLHDLFPQGFLELAAAERIISLHWQLQRLQSAQYHLIAAHHQQYQKRLEDQQEILENKRDRHLAKCEEMGIDCTEEDLKSIGLGQPDPDAPPSLPDPGYFLAQSLLTSHSSGSRFTVEERLLNIESKLHTLLSKAQKHYDHLQKTRQQKEQAQSQQEDDGTDPHCLFLTPPAIDDDDSEDCGAGVPPADADADNFKSEIQKSEINTPDPTPDHTAQQSATFSPAPNQNEATCQNDTFPKNPQPKEVHP